MLDSLSRKGFVCVAESPLSFHIALEAFWRCFGIVDVCFLKTLYLVRVLKAPECIWKLENRIYVSIIAFYNKLVLTDAPETLISHWCYFWSFPNALTSARVSILTSGYVRRWLVINQLLHTRIDPESCVCLDLVWARVEQGFLDSSLWWSRVTRIRFDVSNFAKWNSPLLSWVCHQTWVLWDNLCLPFPRENSTWKSLKNVKYLKVLLTSSRRFLSGIDT